MCEVLEEKDVYSSAEEVTRKYLNTVVLQLTFLIKSVCSICYPDILKAGNLPPNNKDKTKVL